MVPILNEEIKESVNNIHLKRDRRLSHMQRALMKATIAVTEVTEELLKLTDKRFNSSIKKSYHCRCSKVTEELLKLTDNRLLRLSLQ